MVTKNETPKESIHKGHRARMKNRLRQTMGENFMDHELLEISLYYVLPRTNTNDIAHDLLKRFGSLRNICSADPKMIESVPGLGKEAATFFLLLSIIKKRIELERYDLKRFTADSMSEVGNFLVNFFKDKQREEVYAMLLDSSFKLLEFVPVSFGCFDGANVDIPEFTRYAVVRRAKKIILAHNHPSGNTTPSGHDKQISLDLRSNLQAVGIELVEHIIVNEISFAPTLYMFPTSPGNIPRIEQYKKFYNN